jgi:hypothetical protein
MNLAHSKEPLYIDPDFQVVLGNRAFYRFSMQGMDRLTWYFSVVGDNPLGVKWSTNPLKLKWLAHKGPVLRTLFTPRSLVNSKPGSFLVGETLGSAQGTRSK